MRAQILVIVLVLLSNEFVQILGQDEESKKNDMEDVEVDLCETIKKDKSKLKLVQIVSMQL